MEQFLKIWKSFQKYGKLVFKNMENKKMFIFEMCLIEA